MLAGILNSMKRERAVIARDLEYIGEMTTDDHLDDRLFSFEAMNMPDTKDDYLEALAMINEMTVEDNVDEDEINRITEATSDISFDEMIGLEETID